MVLESGAPWEPEDFQLFFVEDLFGGHIENWLVLPEGNGKTTLLSGIALYHADYTPSPAVPIGASSREQAEILYSQGAGFVRRTPSLQKRFRPFDGYRRIKSLRTGGRIQVFAADDRTGDGIIPTLILIDELHRHRDMRLYRTWYGKRKKRGAQVAGISTAGEPGSEFEETRLSVISEPDEIAVNGAFTRAVAGGMVLHDFSVPADGDVEDMEQVKAANPLSTITVEGLLEDFESPNMTMAHWRRFKCNQPVRGSDSAVDQSEWEGAYSEEMIPAGQPIWAGLDLGWKWDTTALVPYWMKSPKDRLVGDPEILVPPRDGTQLHPSEIHSALRRLHGRNPIETVVYDPAVGGREMAAWIEDNLGSRVVEYGHTNAPAALAYERFMEALRQGWLKHPGNDDLTRHVLNATARILPDGRVKFDRPSQSRNAQLQERRVWDALDALAMVNSVAVAEVQEAIDPSTYRIEIL